MFLSRGSAVAAIILLPAIAAAADWKPAPVPLMTKWGKLITPENAWKEYPRPQLARPDWLNLNGLWDYAITAKDARQPTEWPGQILVPFCVESSLSGVGKPVTKDQLLWYRRTIEIPEKWKGKRLLLHFGAVDWEATVSVNGKEQGVHRGGSDPFSFDITDALKAGPNELIVRVWDPTDSGAQPRGKQVMRPESIWYTAVTGIWQTVWLEPVPDRSIESVYVGFDFDSGKVFVEAKVRGDAKSVRLNAIISEQDGKSGVKIASEGLKSLPMPITEMKDASGIPRPKLWSPDSPFIYKMQVSITDTSKSQVVDEIESYVAFRDIKAAKDANGVMRLMLNGKPLFQYGTLDQGWWPDGLLTPPSESAMTYDLKVLKSLGMNMLRKHIKVEPASYYYHCDQLGLLVWQDMPSGGVPSRKQLIGPGDPDATFAPEEKSQFRKELQAMLDHLRGFACIAVWVPFNEGWGQHDTNAILKWVKERDPTRIVDGPSGWADRGFGDMKDMHFYPGPSMYAPVPDRVSVLGEFGGLGLPLKGHLWKADQNWGYQTFKTTDELRQSYGQMMFRLRPMIAKGLSAAVYTQTTDVEIEVNGLMTYDREVIKFDVAETLAWHKALFEPMPELRMLIDTSETVPAKWKYTTDKTGEKVGKRLPTMPKLGGKARRVSARREHRVRKFAPSGRRPIFGFAAPSHSNAHPPKRSTSASITMRMPKFISTVSWPPASPVTCRSIRWCRSPARGRRHSKPGRMSLPCIVIRRLAANTSTSASWRSCRRKNDERQMFGDWSVPVSLKRVW